jgi:hypothetical protein
MQAITIEREATPLARSDGIAEWLFMGIGPDSLGQAINISSRSRVNCMTPARALSMKDELLKPDIRVSPSKKRREIGRQIAIG